jgi:pimeloyl-ACP methyl ester carboxylesterase
MHNSKDHTTLWPKWIGEDVECNAWVGGYGAALSGWIDTAMHLADQGEAFFAALQAEPKLQQGRVVLVGHSLGGLVIKSGMVQAQTLGDPQRERMLAGVAAVVFIGTPHQGADLATVASKLSVHFKVNPQVGNMASNDAWLKLLNAQFRNLQVQRKFAVRVFFETKGVLIGRKLWRLQLGERITIVNANSSDPGIAGVNPTGLEGDHFEIAKPRSRADVAHKALIEFLTRVDGDACPPATLPAPGVVRLDWPEDSELRRRLRSASAPLFSWPKTLPDGTWLERPELEALQSDLDASTASTHFLLGEPGSGKSSLLVRLAQDKQAEGWAVLAIKADRLPPEAVDRESLNRHLNLGADITLVLRHLAQSASVLMVIDQVDALADLVVQQSARLRVLLDLVEDLSDIPGVHTVISCRTFEQKHDPALRSLDATVLTLQLPAWETVLPLLQVKGLRAEAWNEDIQQVLRSPHALDVFLSLLEGATEPAALKSFQGLLEKQWASQVLSDRSGKRRDTLRHLAKLMAEREVLGLPLAIVEEHFAEIQVLAAAGLLRVDLGPGRVEFRHQTLYEFVRARSFLEESGSLTEAVRAQQSALRIRPQLWHALGYFRGASPEEYGVEIGKLWEAGLRPHLKMLLIEFLGRQTAPLPAEQRLVGHLMTDQWFLPRFIGAASGSPGWFAVLAQTHLPELMSSIGDKAQLLVPFLREALNFDPNTVINLLNRYWLPSSSRDILTWQVLGVGDVVPQLGQWLDTLILIAGRAQISTWAVGHVAGVVSAALPDEAPKILAAWLKREIDALKTLVSTSADAHALPIDVTKSIQSVLEARQLHEVEAIAEAAPKAFVLSIWPILVEGLNLCSSRKARIAVGYRQSGGLVFQELDEEDSRNETRLLRSIQLAVQAWADSDASDFLAFAEAETVSELLVVHRLLAIGYLRAVHDVPLRVFEYLIADPRRLLLGPYTDVHKESLALIEAVSPLLSEANFARLEGTVMAWRHYDGDAQVDDDASTRQQKLRWERQHRLRLLRALPLARRSPPVQRLVEEEERAFPGLGNRDVQFSGVRFIGSPVSAEQMDKGTDSDVLNLFDELTDDSAWDHPKDRMKGGAIQAGRELAGLARRDMAKTLRIVRKLEPLRNEIPVASVLRELVPAGLPARELYSLIAELEDKGFVSSGFRREAAYAIASVNGEECSVPDELIDRMECWLTSLSSNLPDEVEDAPSSDNSPLLWGHGSMSALPDGNYPTLSALTTSCLSSKPPRIDRWLRILEEHADRNESPRVWEALLQRELLHLRRVDSSNAEHLVDKLIEKSPSILNEIGWLNFVAQANHWVSASTVQRWVMRTLEHSQSKQGAGELIVLRHALFPAEKWSRELAYSLEGASSSITLGLAHGAAHLWHDPITRPVVHPILVELLRSNDEQVLKALSAVFMRDSFGADVETRGLLDTLVAHPSVLKNGNAEHLPELLAKLVSAEPIRVCRVAHALLDTAGDAMGNISTAWYLSTEWMLDIALQLQDMGETERAAGSTLFERMLEFNMPQAREMTLNLDKRTPANGSPRAPMRRRSRSRRTKQVSLT